MPVYRVPEEDLNPVDRALVAAAEVLGLPRLADLNGDPNQRPGVGLTPRNIAGGVRMPAAFTYLAPARPRPNLALFKDALVDRVLVAGGRAVGVRTADGREIWGREVVLCAGAYGSPAILLRSGIGPAADLHQLGIPFVSDLPGVGAHLLDHPLLVFADYVVMPGYEPAVPSVVPVHGTARSRQATEEIDLHVVYGTFRDEARERCVAFFAVDLQVARSGGRVCLTASDPAAALEIDHCYFANPGDLEALCDSAELLALLIATPPLADAVEPVPGEGPAGRGRDELRAWVRDHAETSYHPSSTCRMGLAGDPGAVVDHAERAHGIPGLRVVDASIFPTSPRANVHCTVVAVAEKLADAIRSDLIA